MKGPFLTDFVRKGPFITCEPDPASPDATHEPLPCADRLPPEGAAVGAGRDAEGGLQVLAQRGRSTEPGLGGDPVDRQVRLLQQLPRVLDALPRKPFPRGDADLVAEAPGEGPGAHRLTRGQV